MRMAIDEAHLAYERGEVPVGCVVSIDGEVIGRAHNLKEALNDPTAHAEILAIREACKRLNRWRLNDATIYVTKEPCPMCSGAILSARIKRLVYGCDDPKAGAVKSLYTLTTDERLNHRVEVVSNVLEDECRRLLRDFFENLRKRNEFRYNGVFT